MENNNILIVDDEESVLNSLKRVFKRENFNILSAGGGDEAIDIIQQNEIAVVVTDERMAGTDGVEVLRNVTEWSPDTFRVLLTGYADMNAVIGAINSGEVHRYVSKPWNNFELLDIVKSGANRYNLLAENRRLNLDILKQRDDLKLLNEHLEERVRERTQALEEKQITMKQNYFEAIQALAVAVDERDAYTHNHSKRVSSLSVLIAKDLGLSAQVVEDIRIGALLHDIGKIGIRDGILLKAGPLTPEEYEEIKTHPARGSKILEPIKDMKSILPIIKYHHERFDGKGYHHLKGLDIPLGARIIVVCDAYDAMTSNRSYRKTMGHDAAVCVLKEKSGTQFDSNLVQSLFNVIDDFRKNEA